MKKKKTGWKFPYQVSFLSTHSLSFHRDAVASFVCWWCAFLSSTLLAGGFLNVCTSWVLELQKTIFSRCKFCGERFLKCERIFSNFSEYFKSENNLCEDFAWNKKIYIHHFQESFLLSNSKRILIILRCLSRCEAFYLRIILSRNKQYFINILFNVASLTRLP